MTADDLRQLRILTLRTIADLVEQHQLPAPMSIDCHSQGIVALRLDDETRDGVTAWADVLDLPERTETRMSDGSFTSVKAVWWSREPVWLGWHSVDVWSACDKQPKDGAR